MSYVRAGILIDNKELISNVLDDLGKPKYGYPKGIAFRLCKHANRDIVFDEIEVLKVWFDKEKKDLRYSSIPLSTISPQKRAVRSSDRGAVPSQEKSIWEHGGLIERKEPEYPGYKKFSFSFFHYHAVEIMTKQGVSGSTNELFLRGSSFTIKNNDHFSFMLERNCTTVDKGNLISETLGLPLFSIGLSCPPDWYDGEQCTKDSLEAFSDKIQSFQ